MKNHYPGKFPLVLLFFCLFSTIKAQFIITNPAGDVGTAAVAEDVSRCTDIDASLTFRLVASPGNDDPEISIVLPSGITYIDGSVSITGTNIAPAPTISANLGTPDNPRFSIDGDFDNGDYVVITLDRIADCEAIEGGGNTDEIFLGADNVSIGVSTSYDVLAANISIVAGMPRTTQVGNTEIVTGTITNGGNGCVNEIDLVILDAPGVETVSVTINGVVLVPDFSFGGTNFYTITEDQILGDGFLCGGESLPLVREVNIISCDLEGEEYRALYGCFQDICGFSSIASQQFNIEFTVPEVVYASGNVQQATNFCDSIIVNHNFVNDGDGAAFDLSYLAGYGASGNVLFGSTGDNVRRFPVVRVTVNGMDVPFTTDPTPIAGNVGLTVDFSSLTSDPVAGSGLEDLDADGAFDDLPAGERFTVRLYMLYECVEECASTRSSGSYRATIDYEDQCGEVIDQVIRPAAGSLANFQVDGGGSVIGPSDVVNGETISLEVCVTRRLTGTMVSCPDNLLSFEANIPTGFTLEPGSTALNGTPAPNAGQIADSVFIVSQFTGSNIPQCFTLDLTLDCDANQGDTDFDFTIKYTCDDACGCVETWGCPIYNPIIHCPRNCVQGGLTTFATRARRSTLGFTDASGDTRATAANLDVLNLKRALPCDTVCIQAEARQIAGLSGPTWDNGYFHMEYETARINQRTLTYAGGEVYVYDQTTMSWDTCPIPPPINDVFEGELHVMDFDLSGCAPNGVFEANDSVFVNLKTVVEKTPGLDAVTPIQIPQTLLYHYNLKDTMPFDGVPDSLFCDRWGLELYLHDAQIGRGGGLVRQSPVGCTTYNANRTYTFSGGPTDLYPGEVRPYFYPDSVFIFSTSFDSLDYSSVILTAAGAAEDGFNVEFPLGTPDIIRGGPGNRMYVWINDGSFPYGDQNRPFNQFSGYDLEAVFSTTCASQRGELEMGYYMQQYAYSQNTDCLEPAQRSSTVPIIPTPARTTLDDRSGVVEVTNDTVRWRIQVQNSSQALANFLFLGFEDGNGNVIEVISLRQLGPDTLLMLEDYPLGQWSRAAGAFPGATAFDYEVTALLKDCNAEQLRVVSGFDCVGYPEDPTTYPCDLNRITLRAAILDSRVQIRLDQQPGPYDLCTQIRDTVVVTSAERAFIDSVTLRIPLPEGLTMGVMTVDVTYPRGSGNTEALPATLSADGSEVMVQLAEHSQIGSTGIAGTDDALNQAEREVSAVFTFQTDCNFFGSSSYQVIVNADRPCGEPAFGDGNQTVSDPIVISGATPTFIGNLNPDLLADELVGCTSTFVNVDLNNDAGTTGAQDSIFVTLPAGLRYNGGGVDCGTTPASACAELVGVEEQGTGQLLLFRLPEGVASPQDLSFRIPVEVEPAGGCTAINEVSVRVVTTRSNVFCVADNAACERFRIVVAESLDTVAFVRNEPVLSGFSACTQDGSFFVQGTVSNLTFDVPADEAITLRFFCPENPAVTLGTQVFTGSITAGTDLLADVEIDAGCSGDITVALSREDDNCVCADAFLDFSPLAEEVVDLQETAAVCRTDSVDLAALVIETNVNSSAVWTTTGDGTFQPDATFGSARFYQPGPQDGRNGEVTLVLTTTPPTGCVAVSDSTVVTILNVDCGVFPWSGGR